MDTFFFSLQNLCFVFFEGIFFKREEEKIHQSHKTDFQVPLQLNYVCPHSYFALARYTLRRILQIA